MTGALAAFSDHLLSFRVTKQSRQEEPRLRMAVQPVHWKSCLRLSGVAQEHSAHTAVICSFA